MQQIAPTDWYDRYDARIEESRLPRQKKEREAWVKAVARDGVYLLTTIYESDTHSWLWEVADVQILRQVWLHQFVCQDGEWELRQAKDLPPSSIRFDSPYDPEAHYSKKRQTQWTGYKVHVTETCDDDQPHLITHIVTTSATQSDADMTAPIHEALAEKECLPETHLADAGYVDADQIVESQAQYGINLLGPVRPDVSWQTRENSGYSLQDFQIDWTAESVTCPRGVASHKWYKTSDAWGDRVVHVRFPKQACHSCDTRSRCTRSETRARSMALREQAQHEALQYARQEQQTEAWQVSIAG